MRCDSTVLSCRDAAPSGFAAEIGAPRPLLGGAKLPGGARVLTFSRARDRFLLAKKTEQTRSARLVVVSDWRSSVEK